MKHYIANGIVNKLKNTSTKLVFVLEDWLKKALTTLHVPHVDDCCDNDNNSRPLKYNKVTQEISYYNDNSIGWTPLPVSATCFKVHVVNISLVQINVNYIDCNGDAQIQVLDPGFSNILNLQKITNFDPVTMSTTFIGLA